MAYSPDHSLTTITAPLWPPKRHLSADENALDYSADEADHLRHIMNADAMAWGENAMLRTQPSGPNILTQWALLDEAIRCARYLRRDGVFDAELWFVRDPNDKQRWYKRRFTLADVQPPFPEYYGSG